MDKEANEKGGEKYLAQRWPKLDTIQSATIVGGTSSTSAAPKPATTSKPAPAPATKP